MDKSNKILIVDDSEINRSLLADMLSADYSLLEASNGLEAMVLINQYHSELSMVLLDIVMPEMDGFEVLASMNGAGLLERLPVIMISAEPLPHILIMPMSSERRNISAVRLMSRR